MTYRTTAVFFGIVATAVSARADSFSLNTTHTGHVDYVFTGNSMTDNTGLANGTNCLLPSNTAPVRADMVSERPRLLQATLYVSGSLIGNDGLDYLDPNRYIFPAPSGLQATNAADLAVLEPLARQAASVSVQFQPPGAAAPVTVSTTSDQSSVAVYYSTGANEVGNIGFFSTPIDVTDVLRGLGADIPLGDYKVSGLVADICEGLEAVCGTTSCGTISSTHTNGNASFALLMVYEDLALPLRSVSVFNGMTILSSSSQVLNLVNGSAVSDPASGSLGYYVLEGDLSIAGALTGVCGGQEYVRVTSSPGPGNAVCLNDADNPVGNIFNGTINVIPATSPQPAGCTGPHLCGLAGVDIDRYDISGGLSAGATQIEVDIGTGSDRIGLAAVVLGVDVFQPLLAQDTQLRLLGPLPTSAQVGATVTFSLAISNTGNLPANNVHVHIDAPAATQGLQVLNLPGGAADHSAAQGGANGTGAVDADGFDVPAGKISEVRFSFTTACGLSGQSFALAANLTADGMAPFTRGLTVQVGGPGVAACAGLDPQGPFADLSPFLRGGGCALSGATGSWWVALAALPWLWRRRRATHGAALLMLVAFGGCGRRHGGTPPPPSQSVASNAGLPGTACSRPFMVRAALPDGTVFCIDRFEASLDGQPRGNAEQSADDTSVTPDGSTQAKAQTGLHIAPVTGVSWYQAKSACLNAGKQLCTVAQWEAACRGTQLSLYPYGDQPDDSACNGFYQYNPPPNPAVTGSFKRCVSPTGAYDMSGNVEEWLDTAVPRVPGTTTLNDRMLHGGSFASNDDALACVGVESHAPPSNLAGDRGFRCCAAGP